MTDDATDGTTGDAPDHPTADSTDHSTSDADHSPADSDHTTSDATAEAGCTSEASDAGDATLTHTDESGTAGMVNVGSKPDTDRRTVARGTIHLRPETITAVRTDELEKGDVLSVARVGAIRAVKHTWEAVPLCHQIPITGTDVTFDVRDDRIVCTVAVETTGKTGCEMEALQGVTGGLTTVWDMVKSAEKDPDGGYPDARIDDVRVLEKRKE